MCYGRKSTEYGYFFTAYQSIRTTKFFKNLVKYQKLAEKSDKGKKYVAQQRRREDIKKEQYKTRKRKDVKEKNKH